MGLSHLSFFLAQSSSATNTAQNIGFLIGFLAMFVFAAAIGLGIAFGILWLIYDAVRVVPGQYQVMPPKHIFFGMIPFFNLVWTFFIVSRVSQTFENYFSAIGRPQPGDYGKTVGLIWAITACLFFIPYLNCITSLTAIVCIIMFIVKVRGFKSLVQESSAVGGFSVMPPGSTGAPPAPGQPNTW